jgi:predicted O-methyltransferase YrrM
MSFNPKKAFKQSIVKAFHVGQRLGFDVLPRHFYSEIPNVARLRTTEAWRQPYSMIGVAGIDADEQLALVKDVMTDELRSHLAAHDEYEAACRTNGEAGYGPIEAQFLFAYVARRQPQRIVQVGCGVSTALCQAAAKYAGYQPRITCIEPYPTDFLQAAAGRDEIELIPQPVENIELDFFSHLGAGDLFFVDSTHTLGPAGEVTRIILEMLPRLPRGVNVHFHDIVFPYDYSPWILSQAMFFWHESPLLHAFLCMNPSYRVLASLAYLHHTRQAELASAFVGYQPMKMDHGLGEAGHFPSSIYLEAVGGPPT